MKSTLLISSLLIVTLGLNACTEELCEEGTPDPNCLCTHEYLPVCGCDGITYSNRCHAACAGIEEYEQGACK